MSQDSEAEIAALKIILSNVVAHLAIETREDHRVRDMLSEMKDECKLAAEHVTIGETISDRSRMVNATLTHIDEFFKGITMT